MIVTHMMKFVRHTIHFNHLEKHPVLIVNFYDDIV